MLDGEPHFHTLPSGAVLVRLDGELDLATAPVLRHHLECAMRLSSEVMVDMRAVSFIDATALGVLVWANQRAGAGQGSLVLIAPRPCVTRVIHAGGLSEVLRAEHDLRSATASSDPRAAVDGAVGDDRPRGTVRDLSRDHKARP